MSASRGVHHSEFNNSPDRPVELLQMWVFPAERGVVPSYEQKRFTQADRTGKLQPIVSSRAEHWQDGDGSLWIGQDAQFYVSRLEPGASLEHPLGADRKSYLFVIDGAPTVNGEPLNKNDSAAISEAETLTVRAGAEPVELLLIDLP